MELVELAHWEMTYRTIELLDYGVDGQIYGTLDGSVTGDRLTADVHLTNLAVRRPDDVNMPTLRGLLRTPDGAVIFAELDGISVLRPADGVRAFMTSVRFRTGEERYAWLNTTTAVLEAVLDRVEVGGHVHARLYECRHTLG